MTERSNREHEELNNLELDAVCGGFINDAGRITPWIVDGKIMTLQPAGPNPWLPRGDVSPVKTNRPALLQLWIALRATASQMSERCVGRRSPCILADDGF